MTETSEPNDSGLGWRRLMGPILFTIAVLLSAAGFLAITFTTEPVAGRETATRKSAMLVETTPAEKGTFQPRIVETGVVTPAQEIQLKPQVAGRIVWVSPNFVPGGMVEEGEVIAEIEKKDFEHRLRRTQSDLAQAEADLQLEKGRQEIAREDYQLLEGQFEGDPSLVLREPQLAAAEARVDAADAAVEQARLDLQRTSIRSPFAARIIDRGSDLGSQVSAGDSIAHLIGIETFWVMTSVPLSKIPYLTFPEDEQSKGAEVKLRNRSAWPAGAERTGHLFSLVGTLGEQTRLANVAVEIDDPLARLDSSREGPPLLIGEFLEVSIRGAPIQDVIRLDRDYLRKDDTTWVMDKDNKLRIRQLEITFMDARHAYVRTGLEDGERVVTSQISTVADGADLRIQGETE